MSDSSAQSPAARIVEVPEHLDGVRLDRAVSLLCPELSRTEARRLIDLGRVRVLGDDRAPPARRPRRPSAAVTAGERLAIEPVVPPAPSAIVPEDIPLDVIYEDDDLAVINKPAGLVVHPGAGRRGGTLVAALLARYPRLPGDAERPGIVHRLDRNTSGLLVVALSVRAMKSLSAQVAARAVAREYRALVWGCPRPAAGTIEVRIARSRRDRRRMAPSQVRGRPAATGYRVLRSWEAASLLAVKLETGRTHQIRVHLAHAGNPVVGDPDYGGRQKGLLGLPVPHRPVGRALLATIDRQALHAYRLAFAHPASGERRELEAPLPADLAACLAELERWRPAAGGAGHLVEHEGG